MWSSQHYRMNAKEHGLSKETIDAAIAQTIAVVEGPHKLPAILTLGHLALRTGVDYVALRGLLTGSCCHQYRHFKIRKRVNGPEKTIRYRKISVPTPDLYRVQRWIAVHVLRSVPVHGASHAFSPGNSIVKCAEKHCGAKWMVKLDILDFFGSISEMQAYRVFHSLGYQPLVSFEMARLCTYRPKHDVPPNFVLPRYQIPSGRVKKRNRVIESYNHPYMGILPQGAPTSPMLANLAMRDIDEKILSIANRFGLQYTRYSDDLTFSTRNDFDRQQASLLIQEIANLLIKRGLMLNRQKTAIIPPGARKIVLGLLVDGDLPRLSRPFKDRIRQHLYYLEKFGPDQHVSKRCFDSVGGFFRHLKGLIDFANMIEPQYARESYVRLCAVVSDAQIESPQNQ
ncbi:MAG: RNA-directed DNA polymerase [Hydrogenophilales bacterium CG_4_10_14_3_um_filter_58_23]|nr:MAG: RNA-directed DNA polymerase [Hydrogenophilales bacterium CG_4_10_14_3_um_filter_58_23]